MEIKIGTDIIEVNRIREAMSNENFASHVFTDNEIFYCERKSEITKYESYSARFAGKEAIFKAISPFLKEKYELNWNEIEIINDNTGRPYVNFIGEKFDYIRNAVCIDVSLSHIKDFAIAQAIVYKK